MVDFPHHRYIEVGGVADVIRLAADGQIPADAAFTIDNEENTLVTWFGYLKTDDSPARLWTIKDNVSFEGHEGELLQ